MDALDERQPSQQEIAHAQKLHSRIKYFDGLLSKKRKSWKKARQYVDGAPEGDDASGLVRVNLIGSFVETLQANIYAKAPEIAVMPEERPDEQEYPALVLAGKTMESALNTMLVKDAKLKPRGKAAVRASLTTNMAWVKLLYQREKAAEPVMKNNLNDIQDNIANLERLRSETEDEGACSDYDAKLVELRSQEQTLQGQAEVQVAEGLVIDNVPIEDIIILDPSIKDIDEIDRKSVV